ncbi:MAG: hypothetical protein ACI9W2_003273 [Gammaproteobacteria bacterium]|jgi:hypothetical protein
MLIVNPTFGRVTAAPEQLKAGSVDWSSEPIALFSNSKPNARELLNGLRTHLRPAGNSDNLGMVYKDSASQPAPDDVLAHVAENYRGAILAIAD